MAGARLTKKIAVTPSVPERPDLWHMTVYVEIDGTRRRMTPEQLDDLIDKAALAREKAYRLAGKAAPPLSVVRVHPPAPRPVEPPLESVL